MMSKKTTVSLIVTLLLIVGGVLFILQSNTSQDTRSRASGNELEELHQQVPNFPVYPGAAMEEFEKREQPLNTNQDVRAEWKVPGKVVPIMEWYLAELEKQGWTIEAPNDRLSEGEQVAHITKGPLSGYVAVEDEGEGVVEIVIDFRKAE